MTLREAPAGAACTPAAPLLRCSIVMPTLDQARFIAAAIDSVLGSDSVADELIVMDGGSRDATAEIVAALAERYGARLRWHSQPDSGPAQAVNRAVAMARGEWIGWLNSDDLYAPGAIDRALQVLREHPDLVMVYGEGAHIDIEGRPLGRYPTLPPETPMQRFLEGCFICQPTGFFRREVFLGLGGLDESLRAAFDFEFWLRLFKSCPGRIGFVGEVQALSRLHEGGITLRQRERVALEGMQVLYRHLGVAPPEWLLTHFEERFATHPGAGEPVDLRADLTALIERARCWLAPGGEQRLRRQLQQDARLRLALPGLQVQVHPDGWAGELLSIRVGRLPAPARRLRLRARHARPGGGSLRLTIQVPGAADLPALVPRPGVFALDIDLPDLTPGPWPRELQVQAHDFFVPAQVEPGSSDRRRLAYRVEAVELLP